MDKRLTYRTEDGWVGVNDQTNGVVSTNSQAVHRLADIEDIMEKYGIDSVEDLEDTIKNVERLLLKATQCERLNKQSEKVSQDRDIWQKACKMACRDALQVIQSDYMDVNPNELSEAANKEAQNYYLKAKE